MSSVVFLNLDATSSYPQNWKRENKQFDIFIHPFIPWRNVLSQIRIKFIIIRFNWSLRIHLSNGQVPFIANKIIFHYQSIWACIQGALYCIPYYWWNQHTVQSVGHPSICGSQSCSKNSHIYESVGNCIYLLFLPPEPCHNHCHLYLLPSFPDPPDRPPVHTWLSLGPPTLDLIFPESQICFHLLNAEVPPCRTRGQNQKPGLQAMNLALTSPQSRSLWEAPGE